MAKRGTAQQMEIVGRLAQGMKRQEIANEVGCNIQTVDRVKAALRTDPVLQELYYKGCSDEIVDAVPLIVRSLINMINDPTVQASAKVAAARELLSRSDLDRFLETTQKEIRIEIVYE